MCTEHSAALYSTFAVFQLGRREADAYEARRAYNEPSADGRAGGGEKRRERERGARLVQAHGGASVAFASGSALCIIKC